MKVDQHSLEYIQNVVDTARSVKIENIIIEPNCVRAMDDNSTIFLLQVIDVPPMPFNAIGLNRIDVFRSRFNIVKTFNQLQIDAVMDDNSQFARALTMKGKGVKIDYRCANPSTIRAPRTMKDTMKYHFQITSETVQLMTNGAAAMSADEIMFIGNDDGVAFEMEDINRDAMNFQCAPTIEVDDNDGDPVQFTYKYPLTPLLALLKQNPDCMIHIGARGTMKVQLKGLDFYIPHRG